MQPHVEIGEVDVDADVKKGETEEQRKARLGAGRVLFKDLTLLAILSILIMTLGAFMLVTRMGRRLRNQKKAKPVKYFDLTVGDGPEPPPHDGIDFVFMQARS